MFTKRFPWSAFPFFGYGVVFIICWSLFLIPSRTGYPQNDTNHPLSNLEDSEDMVLEQARAAAIEYAIKHDFPPAKIQEISENPQRIRKIKLSNGNLASEYQWLGSGKGGGWYLHVTVSRPSLETKVNGGFSSR